MSLMGGMEGMDVEGRGGGEGGGGGGGGGRSSSITLTVAFSKIMLDFSLYMSEFQRSSPLVRGQDFLINTYSVRLFSGRMTPGVKCSSITCGL